MRGRSLRGPLGWAHARDRFGLYGSVEAEQNGLRLTPHALVERELGGELARVRGAPFTWSLRPVGRLSAGEHTPHYNDGDPEAGWASARFGAEAGVYPSLFEIRARAEAGADFDGSVPQLRFYADEAWAGVHTRNVNAGLGLRDRWIGPGRNGSLVLTDNALPAPMASVAVQGRPVSWLGRLYLEAGAGFLQAPRDDVDLPGWLLADLRWVPRPEIELGLSRIGLFGGRGRPAPSLGQLILPTDPHVYDDPDQIEPDQDEIAAFDARLTVPLARWLPRGASSPYRPTALDWIEVWWQYGGEDVIARSAFGVPYPSLAGVANLFGAEVAAGPVSVTWEGSRVLDDTFRWYTGHRVYHDGFTQNGASIAMAEGGDSLTGYAAVSWFPVSWGGELSFEWVRRAGVVQAAGDNLQALLEDERTLRFGARAWKAHEERGWWQGRVVLERTTGAGFMPGNPEWAWYVAIYR